MASRYLPSQAGTQGRAEGRKGQSLNGGGRTRLPSALRGWQALTLAVRMKGWVTAAAVCLRCGRGCQRPLGWLAGRVGDGMGPRTARASQEEDRLRVQPLFAPEEMKSPSKVAREGQGSPMAEACPLLFLPMVSVRQPLFLCSPRRGV